MEETKIRVKINDDTFLNLQAIEIDTMNSDVLNSLIQSCKCMVIIFDKTNYPTFNKAKKILSIVQSQNLLNILLLSNKSDIETGSEIEENEIKKEIDKFKNSFKANIILDFFKYSNVTHLNHPKIKEMLNSIYTSQFEKFPKSIMKLLNEKCEKSYEVIKLILLGDSGVGKSAFFTRFFKNEFDPSFTSTIGIIDAVKYITFRNIIFKVQVWDTAGQERFRSIPRRYYEKADGMILLFDVTDYMSLKGIAKWTKDIYDSVGENMTIYLVGNKIDLIEERKVLYDEASRFSMENKMKYYECSCKWDLNVSEVVYECIYDVYNCSILGNGKKKGFELRGEEGGKKGCCGRSKQE